MWKKPESVKKTLSDTKVTSKSFVCYCACQRTSVSGCDPLTPGSWIACRKKLFGIVMRMCLFRVFWCFFSFCISQLYWVSPYSMPKNASFFSWAPESVIYRLSSVSVESEGNWRALQASSYTTCLYSVFPFSLTQEQWRNHPTWLHVLCCRQWHVSKRFCKHKSKFDSFWECSKTEKKTLLHLLSLLLFVDMNTVNSICFTQGSICITIWPLITQL